MYITGGWWNINKEFMVSISADAKGNTEDTIDELANVLQGIGGSFCFADKHYVYAMAEANMSLFDDSVLDDRTVTYILRQAVGKANKAGNGDVFMRMANVKELEAMQACNSLRIVAALIVLKRGVNYA